MSSYEKQSHPGDGIDAPSRPNKGRLNKKTLLAGTAGGILILSGLYALAGLSMEAPKAEPKGLQPANITAKAPDADPVPPPPTQPPQAAAQANQPAAAPASKPTEEKRSGGGRQQAAPPKNFKVSTLAFGGKYTAPIIQPMLTASSSNGEGSQSGGRGSVSQQMAAGTGAYDVDDGSGGGYGGAGRGGRTGNAKGSFYTGGGGRSGQGLYHPHGLQPELAGCVVKAGEEIIVQNPNPVRTELPGQVRGTIIEDIWGRRFLGNGQVEDCIAARAGSTAMSEVNATGVSRGDMRVQMCATRIDVLGGGIMPMACSPTLGQDGASGVEAQSDYAWGGIATGILIEAALSTVSALGDVIAGPAGVAVNVGTQGMRGVGSEYVNRELMRPPVLTMAPGAIYRIQVNADISFPEE